MPSPHDSRARAVRGRAITPARTRVRMLVPMVVLTPLVMAVAGCRRDVMARGGDPRINPGSLMTIDHSAASRPLYDLVAARWPAMLRADRAVRLPVNGPAVTAADARATMDGPVGVYARFARGGVALYAGGVGTLTEISSAVVESVVRLSPQEERMRFGRAHAAGACVVTFRE